MVSSVGERVDQEETVEDLPLGPANTKDSSPSTTRLEAAPRTPPPSLDAFSISKLEGPQCPLDPFDIGNRNTHRPGLLVHDSLRIPSGWRSEVNGSQLSTWSSFGGGDPGEGRRAVTTSRGGSSTTCREATFLARAVTVKAERCDGDTKLDHWLDDGTTRGGRRTVRG